MEHFILFSVKLIQFSIKDFVIQTKNCSLSESYAILLVRDVRWTRGLYVYVCTYCVYVCFELVSNYGIVGTIVIEPQRAYSVFTIIYMWF